MKRMNYIIIGIIVMILGTGIGTYLIQKGRTELAFKNTEKIIQHINTSDESSKKEILNSIDLNQEEVSYILKKHKNDINFRLTNVKDSIQNSLEEGNSKIVKKVNTTKKEIIDNQTRNLEKSNEKVENSTTKIVSEIDKVSNNLNENQKEIISEIDELKNPPKNPNALYRNNEKKGLVKNFVKQGDKFTIDEIIYDKQILSMDEMFSPFEYKNYIIKITNIKRATGMPPGAIGIQGIILNEK